MSVKNLNENYIALFEDDGIDPKEYDYEGDMAKSQLVTMMDAAEELHDMLDDTENLPEWAQNKISKATDYIDSVRDYMIAAKSDDIEDDDDDDNDNKNEAYSEPQGQAKRMMSPLHKMRMDKEKKDRDSKGRLKAGIGAMKKAGNAKAKAELGEGYEQEVIKILNKKGIDGYFKNNALYVSRRDVNDAKKALKKAINIYQLPRIVGEGHTYENFKQSINEEDIQEKLKPSMGIGSYIKDFSKSDAPQFKGKSEKERRDMAVAAYLSAKRGDK